MCFIHASVIAQQPTFTLKGVVNVAPQDREGITVQNVNSNNATITNSNGFFSISVKENDTLIIRSLQFSTTKIIINKSHKINPFITLNLLPKVNQLEEVTVMPYNLTGSIAHDAKQINTDNYTLLFKTGIPNAGVILPTKNKRKLYTAVTSPNGLSVDYIINIISGRIKRLKSRIAHEEAQKTINSLANNYEDLLLSNTFNLKQEHIYSFLDFCAQDAEFSSLLSDNNNLKLFDFLKLKCEEFKAINKL